MTDFNNSDATRDAAHAQADDQVMRVFLVPEGAYEGINVDKAFTDRQFATDYAAAKGFSPDEVLGVNVEDGPVPLYEFYTLRWWTNEDKPIITTTKRTRLGSSAVVMEHHTAECITFEGWGLEEVKDAYTKMRQRVQAQQS